MNDTPSQRLKLLLPPLVIVVLACIYSSPPLINVDWGWQTRVGDRIIDERSIPSTDIFSWTAGDRLDRHPRLYWGIGVLLSSVNRIAGIPGLIALRCLLVAILYVTIYAFLRRQRLPAWPAVGLIAAVMSCTQFRTTMRPHMFSFIFVVVVLWLLMESREERRRRLLFLVPVVYLFWANLHPGVILGLGVLGFYVLGEGIRLVAIPWRAGTAIAKEQWRYVAQLAAVVVGATVATVFTPSGYDLHVFLFEHRQMYERQNVNELAPISLADGLDRQYLSIMFLLLLAYWRRDSWRETGFWCAWLFYTVMTFSSHRFYPHSLHLLLLALWAVPAVPLPSLRERRPALLVAVIFGGMIFYHVSTDLLRAHPLIDPMINAPELADFLEQVDTPAPLYNTGHFGGYLVYRFKGEKKVFKDGRQSLFRHLSNRDWRDLYQEYQFRTVALATGETLYSVDASTAPKHWALVFFSDYARVYVDTRTSKGQQVAAAHGFKHVRFDLKTISPEAPSELVIRVLDTDPALAKAELEQQLARDPKGYYSNLAMGLIYLKLGERDAAARAARLAVGRRLTAESVQLLQLSSGAGTATSTGGAP